MAAITYPTVKNGTKNADSISGVGVTTNLKISGLAGNDTLIGVLTYNNYIDGGEGNDKITGGNLADELFGGSGTGADTINGGGGNDTITGGGGADVLRGDAGADTFKGVTYGDQINLGVGDKSKDKIEVLNGDNCGQLFKSTAGINIYHGATIFDFQKDPNIANDVDTFDKIDLRSVSGAMPGTWIFDSVLTEDTGQASQKSIFMASYLVPDKGTSFIYKSYVAIDYVGDNDYDVVFLMSGLGTTLLTSSDFLL